VLRPEARSVSEARRFTRHMCEKAGLASVIAETAVLLTSETVTNAIVHGHSEVRLTVRVDGGGVRVETGDDNSRHPVPQSADADALDGRGLALIEAASSRWGVTDEDYGKVVWFELRRSPACA
jgi:anti-sigma regulatory factor (Ser/Thr protein kinase)